MIRRVKSARSGRAKPKDPFSQDSPRKDVHAFPSTPNTFNINGKEEDNDVVPRLRQRSMSAMTPERPSTSSGLTDSQSSPANSFHIDSDRIDRRVSRDDSWLGRRSRSKSRPRTNKSKLGWSTSRKPSSPEVSPTSSPVLEASTPPVSLDDDIGLALGSPTSRQSPMSWNSWTMGVSSSHNISKPSNLSTVTSTADLPADTADEVSPRKPRKTSGKWKILGLFGRKQSEPVGSSGGGTMVEYNESERLQAQQGGAATTNGSKFKALAVRSHTMPNVPQIIEPEHRARPRLDVEVPNVKFDRYSVMFGSVLQQQQQAEQQPQQSGLLARRQATMPQLRRMDNVKEEDERSIRSHQRRATSPDPTGTKTFTDYDISSPAMTRHLNKPHRLSPLARSSTSPAYLFVPHGTYEQIDAQDPPHVPPKDTQYTSSPKAEPSTTPFPRTKDQKLAESKLSSLIHGYSAEVLDASEDGEYHAVSTATPYRPEQEPRRSPNTAAKIIVSNSERSQTPQQHHHNHNGQLKTPSTASSSVSSLIPGKRSPSVASSSAHTNVTQPSPRQEKDASTGISSYPANNGSSSTIDSHYAQNWAAGSTGALVNPNSMDPVDVSIARQISISRQQRTLLQNSRQQRQQQQPHKQQQPQQQKHKLQQQLLEAERQPQYHQTHLRNRSFSVSVESSSPNPTESSITATSNNDSSPTAQRRQEQQQRPRAASAVALSPTNPTFNTSISTASAPIPRPAGPVRLPSTRLPRPSLTTKRKASAAAINVMTRYSACDERVGETRSQTPTLVMVPDSSSALNDEDDHQAEEQGISPGGESNASSDFLGVSSPLAQQRRKSSRIVLETA